MRSSGGAAGTGTWSGKEKNKIRKPASHNYVCKRMFPPAICLYHWGGTATMSIKSRTKKRCHPCGDFSISASISILLRSQNPDNVSRDPSVRGELGGQLIGAIRLKLIKTAAKFNIRNFLHNYVSALVELKRAMKSRRTISGQWRRCPSKCGKRA